MATSATKRKEWEMLTEEEKDRIVRMAWEDRTAFELIELQFGLSANEVVRFMRTQLDERGYKRWRRRATSQGQQKHQKNVTHNENRFKCRRQRIDGSTKGWK